MTIVDDWKRNFLIKILISVAENKAINFCCYHVDVHEMQYSDGLLQGRQLKLVHL